MSQTSTSETSHPENKLYAFMSAVQVMGAVREIGSRLRHYNNTELVP